MVNTISLPHSIAIKNEITKSVINKSFLIETQYCNHCLPAQTLCGCDEDQINTDYLFPLAANLVMLRALLISAYVR